MEKNRKNRSPQHDGGGMLAQVQASVEILSPVPLGGKCGEKDYERLFIREAEVKAREGKMACDRARQAVAVRLHRPCAYAPLQPVRGGDKEPLRPELRRSILTLKKENVHE